MIKCLDDVILKKRLTRLIKIWVGDYVPELQELRVIFFTKVCIFKHHLTDAVDHDFFSRGCTTCFADRLISQWWKVPLTSQEFF